MNKYLRLEYWLCLLFNVHSCVEVRTGECVGSSSRYGKFLFAVPFESCIYCGIIFNIPSSTDLERKNMTIEPTPSTGTDIQPSSVHCGKCPHRPHFGTPCELTGCKCIGDEPLDAGAANWNNCQPSHPVSPREDAARPEEISDEAKRVLMDLCDGYVILNDNGDYLLVKRAGTVSRNVWHELDDAGFLKGFANGGGCWVSDEGRLAYIRSTDEMGDGKIYGKRK